MILAEEKVMQEKDLSSINELETLKLSLEPESPDQEPVGPDQEPTNE